MGKKDSPPYISPTKLWKRLNEVEQENNLGTFDNIIIASLFLVLALSTSVLLWLFSNLDSIFKFILVTVILFFLLLLSQIILGYLDSTIFKRNRFTNKINAFTILLSLLVFVILVISIPLGLEFLFPNLNQSDFLFSIAFFVYGVPIIFAIHIHPKITSFFVRTYPNLFLKAINKMNSIQRAKSLKKIKMTFIDLKSLASKY